MSDKPTISIGADHAGFEYKDELIKHLESQNYTVINHGTNTANSTDYPDHVHPVASDVATQKALFGIAICGSGEGVCMTVNKHQDIRGALCWNVEVAALTRQHNDANIICIPARFVAYDTAQKMVEVFLNTEFEGGRHQRRVDKIACK